MDSFFRSIGNTLNIVGKAILPQGQEKKEEKDKEDKQSIQVSQLAVAGLGLNNNLKPRGAPASIASPGMF